MATHHWRWSNGYLTCRNAKLKIVKMISTHRKINASLLNIKKNQPKPVNICGHKIGNKLSKFHGNILSLRKNIAKNWGGGEGYLFRLTTYGHCANHRTSPPTGQYQIIPLGDSRTQVWRPAQNCLAKWNGWEMNLWLLTSPTSQPLHCHSTGASFISIRCATAHTGISGIQVRQLPWDNIASVGISSSAKSRSRWLE